MTDLARLGLEIRSDSVATATSRLERFSAEGRKAEGAAGRIERSTNAMSGAFKGAALQIASAVGAFVSIQRALGAADQYQGMINGLRAMGQSADQAVASLDAVSAIATRTRSPLEATAKLYQRISVAGADLGATQQDVLRFTENVGLALAASGTSANEASGALLQLSQAMAGGTVRAEEFSSILEGAYPIALAAAQGIEAAGGSVGQLRKLVVEGKVSSEEFFDAIISQTDALEAAFASTVPIIGQATTVLGDSFTMMIGKMDAAIGVSAAIAEAILLLADNLDRVAVYAGTAAVVFGGVYVASLVAAAGVTATLTGALKLLRVALIKSGIGIAVVAVGELVFQFTKLVEKTGSVGGAFNLLKDVAATVFTRIGDAIGGVTNFFLAFVADTLAAGQEWAADLVDAAKGMVVGFVDGFKDLGTKVVQAFKDAWSSIVTEVSGWPADMAEIGRNIIQGLINGITGKENEVNDKLRDVMTDGINTVKDVSGVQSPSVVFAGIGSDLMAGMAIGIEAGAGEVETTLIRSGKTVVKTYSDTLRDAAAENRAYAESARQAGQEALDGLFAPIPALQALEAETAKATEEIKELEGATKPAAGQAKALAKELSATERAAKGAAGAQRDLSDATGEAVEKLQEQIQQERELIGISDDLKFEIEARQRVEDALAQDKLTWNEQAIQGLTDQIILNRQLREEAEQTSGVLRTVFDGLAKGDLKSIGTGLMDMARNSFSGLLQDSFAKGGKGLKGVWDTISGGFTGIGAAFSKAGGGLAGLGSAVAGMLPGIGSALAVVDVVKSFVGTTTKLTNAIEGTLGVMGLLRGTEYDIKQKDNIFGSKTEKNAEEIFGSWAKYIAEDLDQEFRDMVQNTRDGIRSLGLEIDEAFTYDFDVQFDESLPHEQLMERLRAELNKANDELLRTSLAAAGLARDGESGAQTLAILNESLQAVNGSMRLLDQSLLDVSAVGAGAARELVELAGGIDAFTSKTAFVFNNFLSESDRTARGLQIATENMEEFEARAGITLPKTHAEFMALLDAQDLTTEAGRELYAGLLDIADEFVTVNGAVGDLAGAAGSTREQIADMYREILGREPDMEGLNFWVDAVQNADYTIGSVASMMGRSFERLGLNAKTQAEFEKLSYEERDRIFQLRYEADKEAQRAELELTKAREGAARASEKAARRERQQAEIEAQMQKNEEAFARVADVYAAQILGGVRDMASVLREFPGATKEAIEKAFENIGPVELSNSFNTPALFGGQITTGNQIVADQIKEVNRTYQEIAIGMIEGLGDEFQGLMEGYFDYVAVNENKVRSAISALEDMGEARQDEIDVLQEVLSELGNARTITAAIRSNLIAQKFNILKTSLDQLTEELGSSEFEQATSSLSQLSQVLNNLAVSANAVGNSDLSQAAQDQVAQFDAVQNVVNQAEGFIKAAVVKPIAESLAIAAPELEALAGNLFDDIVALAGGIQEGDSGIGAYSDAVTRLSDMFINGGLSLDAYNGAFALFNEQLGEGVGNLKRIADLERGIEKARESLAYLRNTPVGFSADLSQVTLTDDEISKIPEIINQLRTGTYALDVSSMGIATVMSLLETASGELGRELDALKASVDVSGEPIEALADAISGLSEEAQNELKSLTETRNRLQAELDGNLPEYELAQLLSDEARAVQLEINNLTKALEDQAEATQQAADSQRELESVQSEIARLQAELAGNLPEYERSLLLSDAAREAYDEMAALKDILEEQTEAAQRAADVQRELDSVREQLSRARAEAEGQEALRAYELSLLQSEAAKEAQIEIYKLADELDNLAKEAQEAASLTQELKDLERQLLQLQGDTAAIRALELAELAPSNRALQERVYALQDEVEAARALEAALGGLDSAIAAESAALARSVEEAQQKLDAALGNLGEIFQILEDRLSDALSNLSDAIDREVADLEQSVRDAEDAVGDALSVLADALDAETQRINDVLQGLISERDALNDQLFPDEALQNGLEIQDFLTEGLDLAKRLSEVARDVLGQNVEIAEQQRKAALSQLRGMLSAGEIDVDNVEDIARRASTFDTNQYATREEMQFDQLVTANTISELAALQEQLANEAQAAEEARVEEARNAAFAQIDLLEQQIVEQQNALDALDSIRDQFDIAAQTLLSIEDAIAGVQAAQAALAAAEQNAADRQGELDAIRDEFGILVDAVLSVEEAVDAVNTAQFNIDEARSQAEIQGIQLNAINSGFGLLDTSIIDVAEAIDAVASAQVDRDAAQTYARTRETQLDAIRNQFGVIGGKIEDGLVQAANITAEAIAAVFTAQGNTDAAQQVLDGVQNGSGSSTGGSTGGSAQVPDEFAAARAAIESQRSTFQALMGDAQNALSAAQSNFDSIANEARYLYAELTRIYDRRINYTATVPEISWYEANIGRYNNQVIPSIAPARSAVEAAQAEVNRLQDALNQIDAAEANLRAQYPSYAKGTDYHPGGPAYLHQNELINLPRGTSVSTAGEVREMVNEIKALRKSNENMALELRQVRKLAESRTNIAEDKRAEELQAAAEATA